MSNYHDTDFFNSRFFCKDFFTKTPFFSTPFFAGMHEHCASVANKATILSAGTISDFEIVAEFDKVIDLNPSHYSFTVGGTAGTVVSASYHPSDDHKVIIAGQGYPFTSGSGAILLSHTGADDVNTFTDFAVDNNADEPDQGDEPIVCPKPKAKRKSKAK